MAREGRGTSSHFSPLVNNLFLILFLACFSLYGWLVLAIPAPLRTPSPERGLGLVVSRTMEFQEGYLKAPLWKRLLIDVWDPFTTAADEQKASIAWYEELTHYSEDPVAHIHLAILMIEAGDQENLQQRLEAWEDSSAMLQAYAKIFKAASPGSGLDRERAFLYRTILSETLPEGWFSDRLSLRLAQEADEGEQVRRKRQALEQRAGASFHKAFVFSLIEVILVVGGIVVLAFALKGKEKLAFGTALLPPPWPAYAAGVVLLRGATLAMILGLLFSFGSAFVGEESLLLLLALPVCYIPLLLLAHRHLWGVQRDLRAVFGLSIPPGAGGKFLFLFLAGIGAEGIGNWLAGVTGSFLRLQSHWTEGFDPDLIWEPFGVVALAAVEYIALVPFLEEVAFRGIFYGTLRRKWGWIPSAMVSAFFFSLIHGYSAVGFFSVFISGFVWAWMYEKGESLLLPIAAHATGNFLYVVGTVVLWRLP